ncbi:MAG: hypothetical protein LBF37_02080 [Rickettsiales bacterium]|nr:hypothetical protein [Rickettsiales bacterium]
MKRQIDHFLLGLLWLLASTLGASFWFNTRFGFNIFSVPHWQYLGQLQASKASIQPTFYISMIIIVVVMVAGLYCIVRPRFRKINFKSNTMPAIETKPQTEIETPAPVIQTQPDVAPTPQQTVPSVPAMARPPRLTIPTSAAHGAAPYQERNNYTSSIAAAQPVAQTPAYVTPAPTPLIPVLQPQPENTTNAFDNIEQVFKSAGYSVKKPPCIGGIRPALFAIGSDEALWVGSVGIEPDRMANIVDKLDTIFTETLEDIKITINAFIINPKITNPIEMGNVEKFDSVDALRDYMASHPNRELPKSEAEDFDAYSEYIDTVADYFNKS